MKVRRIAGILMSSILLAVLVSGCGKHGKEVYDPILSVYRSLDENIRSGDLRDYGIKQTENYLKENYPEITDAILASWITNDSETGSVRFKVWYAFHDVNKDGIPELYISCQGQAEPETAENADTPVYYYNYLRQVYTYANGNVIPLFDDTLELYEYEIIALEDSLVYTDASYRNDPREMVIIEFELEKNGKLEGVEKFVYKTGDSDRTAKSDRRSINLDELLRAYHDNAIPLQWKELQ